MHLPVILIVIGAVTETANARLSFGSCPEVKQMSGFDKYQYIGKWYEIVRDYQNPFTYFTMCVTMEFGPIQSEGQFD